MLLEQAKIGISDDQKKFFIKMNDFQLEGRYPDYKQKIYNEILKDETDSFLLKVNEERKWLLKEAANRICIVFCKRYFENRP